MKIKKFNWFVKLITFGCSDAITLAPFGIYVKEGHTNKRLINHEKIHWYQQMEMLVIFFYIWYILEWFVKLFFSPFGTYLRLSFEREAYDNEDNLIYLKTRKHFAWFKRIIK